MEAETGEKQKEVVAANKRLERVVAMNFELANELMRSLSCVITYTLSPGEAKTKEERKICELAEFVHYQADGIEATNNLLRQILSDLQI